MNPVNCKATETSTVLIEMATTKDHKYGAVNCDENSGDATKVTFDLKSMAVVGLCCLLGDMARGIFFPTLWLYLHSLGANRSVLGVAVAAFSAGRIVSTPLFGQLSEQYGYRTALLGCEFVCCLGCLSYTFAKSPATIVASQLLMGFGAGNLGVLRSYVAENSTPSNRTSFMAYLTALQYTGFTVTPILGAVLSSACSHAAAGSFLNQFSAPAMFMLFLAVICMALLTGVFRDIVRPQVISQAPTNTAEQSEAANAHVAEEGAGNRVAEKYWLGLSLTTRVVIAGCLLNVATKGTIGAFETLGSEFASMHFNWTSVRCGSTFAFFGLCGVINLLLFPVYLKRVSDRFLVMFGMAVMVLSCLLMTFSAFVEVSTELFYTAMFLMYSIGYPIGHTAVLGVFSRIVKTGPQGAVQGWFGSSGSFGRIFFPLLAGMAADAINDGAIFSVMAITLIVSMLCIVANIRSLNQILEGA